jgi:glutathione synthase
VLYLRYNPVEDDRAAPWEHDAGIIFGQMAVLQGVIVLSHPYTLPIAVNKMYLEHFPESIRPRTVITRSYEEIVRFHEEQKGKIVLKPLRATAARTSSWSEEDAANLRQIVESIARSGYVIAQEYLPEAKDGDTRLFLFNGKPLVVDGKYAALRRVNGDRRLPQQHDRGREAGEGGDHPADAGDRRDRPPAPAGRRHLRRRPRHRRRQAGGDQRHQLRRAERGGKLEGVDFGEEVVRLIERKVAHRRQYGRSSATGRWR